MCCNTIQIRESLFQRNVLPQSLGLKSKLRKKSGEDGKPHSGSLCLLPASAALI
jgi:hypothetical protein